MTEESNDWGISIRLGINLPDFIPGITARMIVRRRRDFCCKSPSILLGAEVSYDWIQDRDEGTFFN